MPERTPFVLSGDPVIHRKNDPTQEEKAMTGADLIAAERQRQIEAEGWTPEHDAEHDNDDLALAAVCYATPKAKREMRSYYPHGDTGDRDSRPWGVPRAWPWSGHYWKPSSEDRVRELVKAGALIAAEIDRLQRAQQAASESPARDGYQAVENG